MNRFGEETVDVCVCVCVYEERDKERETERERQTADRQTDRHNECTGGRVLTSPAAVTATVWCPPHATLTTRTPAKSPSSLFGNIPWAVMILAPWPSCPYPLWPQENSSPWEVRATTCGPLPYAKSTTPGNWEEGERKNLGTYTHMTLYMTAHTEWYWIVKADCHLVAIAHCQVVKHWQLKSEDPGSIPGGCQFFTVLYKHSWAFSSCTYLCTCTGFYCTIYWLIVTSIHLPSQSSYFQQPSTSPSNTSVSTKYAYT